ncbi:hypothetical protein SEPCBS119000_003866 [Sporothrix epigloea]|uniref:Proteophosphoglycan ppg4 n=1 Tax=Sporothrix epigloea TaxID=1892477 RepID=A0ABP0DRW2_9PEZI
MADPPLASNNPFRRRSTAPSTLSPIPSADDATAPGLNTIFPQANQSIAKNAILLHNSSDASPSVLRSFTEYAGVPGIGGSLNDTTASDYRDRAGGPQISNVDAFREQLQALPKSSEAPPSTTFLKPKPIKKVRVQSPPPSLPSSVDSADADFLARFPANVENSGGAGGATGISSTFDYAARGGLLDDRPIQNYADDSSESEDSVSDDADSNDQQTSPNSGSSPATTTPLQFPAPQQTQASIPAPPNPFQKTSDELEQHPQTLGEKSNSLEPTATTPTAKATMDVDAFRRLLLTGQGPVPIAARLSAADSESTTEPSSASRHSYSKVTAAAQEATPRTSHEISENDDDRSGPVHGALPAVTTSQRLASRKKPPPPSSRHGKLIEAQPKKKGPESANEAKFKDEDVPSPSLPASDFDKPLPRPPLYQRAEDDTTVDNNLDREAVGKLPESNFDSNRDPVSQIDSVPVSDPAPSLQSPPSTIQTPSSSSHPKKPTPAPPPRRQAHNRPDSRSNPQDRHTPHAVVSEANRTGLRDRSPVGSPRSSFDSTAPRSRSPSLIKVAANVAASAPTAASVNIPAPPPPRRINHVSRPTTNVAPIAVSLSSPADVPESEHTTPRPASNEGAGLHKSSTTTPSSMPPNSVNNGGSSTPLVTVPSRLAKPPPPPARNSSVRNKDARPGPLAALATERSSSGSSGRPASVASVDAIPRRIGGSQMAPPPPPPPTRHRGSSRGSMDTPAHLASLLPNASPTSRQVSSESVPLSTASTPPSEKGGSVAENSEMASNILADLDALQREVDALRGQFKADL